MSDSTQDSLTLEWLAGVYAVCQLPREQAAPGWANVPGDVVGGLWSVTRTDREVSIVMPEAAVPADVLGSVGTIERGWRAMRVVGTLEFSMVGILSRLTSALADADVSVFAISTYDTDYLLVKSDETRAAMHALAHVAKFTNDP